MAANVLVQDDTNSRACRRPASGRPPAPLSGRRGHRVVPPPLPTDPPPPVTEPFPAGHKAPATPRGTRRKRRLQTRPAATGRRRNDHGVLTATAVTRRVWS